MKFDPQHPHRRSIRLQGYDYTQSGAYYITIVTHQREHLFGEVVDGEMNLNRFGLIAREQWQKLQRRFKHLELFEFIIMPNHIHGIIVITCEAEGPTKARLERFGKPVGGSIPTIVRSYKSAVALRINLVRGTKGHEVWQSNYYEHVIRDEQDLQAKCGYIAANPSNWPDDEENRRGTAG